MKKLLGILVLGLLWFSIGYAHQPVLNDTNPISFELPYIIEKPEISKAIYTTLNGKPHIYKIFSDKSFKFYVGLTVPKIDECKDFKKYSFEILDSNRKVIKNLMVKASSGGLGMKNMENNGIGLVLNMEKILKVIQFLKKENIS
jgi:hypothetical protein